MTPTVEAAIGSGAAVKVGGQVSVTAALFIWLEAQVTGRVLSTARTQSLRLVARAVVLELPPPEVVPAARDVTLKVVRFAISVWCVRSRP